MLFNQRMRNNPMRQGQLGMMLVAESGDKVRFTYNEKLNLVR